MGDRGLAGGIREQLRFGGESFAADARRNVRNARASLKLLVLAALASVLMGVAGWAFLAALRAVTGIRDANPWLFLLLPAVGAITTWFYRKHGLRASRGNNLVIDSTLTGTPIHARMAVLTFCCGTATHLAGGSAGREGAAVQMGGTIASNVASIFHVTDHDRRDLMMAGISAAFGAAFGAPLAGAFFGMEMCFIGKLDYSAGLYCLAGSFIGNAVSRALGTPFMFQSIPAVPDMTPEVLALVVASAVAFGLTARLFSLAIRTVKAAYARFFSNPVLASAVGGAILAALFLGVGLTRFGGLSEWMPAAAFQGHTGLFDPFIKLGMTALTVGAGFQGGEVTPLFGIGSSLGGWIGNATLGDPGFMAALGMLGVFGSALNVPITTVMLGIDMFGGGASGYFVIVAFISYLVAGHRAVYAAQRIVTPKRRSLKADESLTVNQAIERHHEVVLESMVDQADNAEAASPAVAAEARSQAGAHQALGEPDDGAETRPTASAARAAADETSFPTGDPSEPNR